MLESSPKRWAVMGEKKKSVLWC